MGEIQPGDTVFDERGNSCHVVAKSPVDYAEQAYRITFKDGQVIEAGERHQWCGEYTRGKRKSCVMTTGELYRLPKDGRTFRFRIAVADAIRAPEKKLPVHPYLMGYWLGNGNATKPEITVQTRDIPSVLAHIQSHHRAETAWQNVGDSVVFRIPDLKPVLLKSFHDKVIPMEYLRASHFQRLELLQGLMDSDGAISDRKGQAVYTSTEKALAESVSELLWSLGIKNAITHADSTQRIDWSQKSCACGRKATGETLYYVKFTAFDDMPIAGLPRKARNRICRNPATRSHFRYIDSIEPIANRGMQCIQVDSPSHQYLVGRSFLPTHNSELAAAVALLLTCGDGEERAEVYGCAADRQQASIVFEVAADMVRMCPALAKRVKINASMKRMIYLPTNSFYQVLSAEAYSKHGFNIHGVVFDELHTQPNRKLFDVMTKGSGDARMQPLYFLITTAGTDTKSICYETHQKAKDILEGRKIDPTFYPVIYGADESDDWTDPKVWKKANPSLGITVGIDKVKAACESAKQNPAEENAFRQLRLNQWVKQAVRWMPMSPPTKELMKLVLEERIAHGGHPVLRWMMDNIFIRTDPAGNIKPDKEKSTEKIDGAVATIMALDRAIRCGNDTGESVYDSRGLLFI